MARQRLMRSLYLATAVQATGFGMVGNYQLVYLHNARHIAYATAGVALAAGGVVGALSTPLIGAISDRFGASRILRLGFLLAGADFFLYALVHTVLQAVLVSAVSGVFNSMLWPTRSTLVGELLEEPDRPKAFGLFFTLLNAGVGVGSLIAGSIIHLHQASTFVLSFAIAGSLGVFSSIIALIGTHGYHSERHVRSVDDHERSQRGGYVQVLKDRPFRFAVMVNMGMTFFGYGQLGAGWTAYATTFASATPRVVSFAFLLNTALIVVLQTRMTGVTDGMRRSRALSVTNLGWCAAWVLTAVATLSSVMGTVSDLLLILSLGLFGVAETIFAPIGGSLANDLAPVSLRGRYNATFGTSWAISQVVSVPVAGVLIGTGVAFVWVTPAILGTFAMGLLSRRLGRVLPPRAEMARRDLPDSDPTM